jgi:putative ABC transport system permease protein
MTRIYRLLLRAYPSGFRARYEDELIAAFAAERDQPRYAGAFGALAFWLHLVADVAVSAQRARRHGRNRIPTMSTPSRSTMEAFAQDLRHAFRQLVRRPGFTAVAVLSLALGIGGNTVILAFVDGFVLHPFPYPDPDRVVAIGSTFPRVSSDERFIETISVPEFLDISRTTTIGSMAVFDLANRNISGGDRPERVFTALAVTDLFGPFGLRPALGRGFTADELAPRGAPVAVISHRLWQSRFAGDPSVVGRAIRVNGTATTVVGIMPPELLLIGTDLWLPLGAELPSMPRNGRQFTVIGRLAPGATLKEANAELAAVAAQTAAGHAAAFEEYAGWRLSAVPWVIALTRDVRPATQLLVGAVGLVLLIACVNLSNLSLARSTTRQREMAVRLALGAGRAIIARHTLAEVALLATAGGALGVLLAIAGLPAVVSLVPADANTLGLSASINARVLAWTAAFTIGSAALVAILPVFQSTRTTPLDVLKSEARGATSGRARIKLRHALITAEIALSVILLVGAGLFVRSFVNLRQVALGFDAGSVLTMRLTLPAEKYRGTGINAFFEQLLDRLDETPGVRSASVASQFPPRSVFSVSFRIEGLDAPADTMPTALITVASLKHFATLGVPLLEGRGFARTDGAGPLVAVVNQAFVSKFLPGTAPLGRRIVTVSRDLPPAPIEIVGVVGNTQNRDMRNPPSPELFVPLHPQTLNNQLFLLVRTAGEAAAMLPTVRQQIAAIDTEQPIYAIRTLGEVVDAATFGNRFSMILFAMFATVALTLAAIGIYGVMSYAVTARTQEIGVRLAVGAGRGDVIWMVLKQVLRLTAIGLALGMAGVVAAGAVIRNAVFQVQPADPVTIAVATVVLAAVALFAGWLPAWRASRIDPVSALRYE